MGSDFTNLNARCHGPVPLRGRRCLLDDPQPVHQIAGDHESSTRVLSAARDARPLMKEWQVSTTRAGTADDSWVKSGFGSETGRPETPGLGLASQRRRTGRYGGSSIADN